MYIYILYIINNRINLLILKLVYLFNNISTYIDLLNKKKMYKKIITSRIIK